MYHSEAVHKLKVTELTVSTAEHATISKARVVVDHLPLTGD